MMLALLLLTVVHSAVGDQGDEAAQHHPVCRENGGEICADSLATLVNGGEGLSLLQTKMSIALEGNQSELRSLHRPIFWNPAFRDSRESSAKKGCTVSQCEHMQGGCNVRTETHYPGGYEQLGNREFLATKGTKLDVTANKLSDVSILHSGAFGGSYTNGGKYRSVAVVIPLDREKGIWLAAAGFGGWIQFVSMQLGFTHYSKFVWIKADKAKYIRWPHCPNTVKDLSYLWNHAHATNVVDRNELPGYGLVGMRIEVCLER